MSIKFLGYPHETIEVGKLDTQLSKSLELHNDRLVIYDGGNRRKSIKKSTRRRKNGGGIIHSTSVSKVDCINNKKRVKEEIEEVKAALEPQFNMAEKVNKKTMDDGYTFTDLKDYLTYRGIKLDKGMENRLIELYKRKIKFEEQCPDEKKDSGKRKTRRRNKKENK